MSYSGFAWHLLSKFSTDKQYMKNDIMKQMVKKRVNLTIILLLVLFFNTCKDEEIFVKVKSMSLDKTALTLTEGDIISLVATIIPENATNKHISWKSSNEKVASVDDEGKVTALHTGNTIIVVTTEDGEKSDTCAVLVNTLGQTLTTLDQVIYDMVGTPFRTLGGFTKPWGSHEGYLHGLPSSWDWYHGARPLDWMENGDNTAISSWGQVFEWSEGSPVKDVRIQIRNHHMFIYTNNQWILAEDVSANIEAGHFLEGNFENSGSTSPCNEKKDGGVSFPVKEDNCLHWFKKVFGSEKRSKLPEGFQAIFISCEIRIIHGSNSKADIENAKYLAGVGADYYLTEESKSEEHTPSLAISRHKFLSTEWQTFTAYISGHKPISVEEYRNEILKRPLPPGVVN
jgi:hypothetical protein